MTCRGKDCLGGLLLSLAVFLPAASLAQVTSVEVGPDVDADLTHQNAHARGERAGAHSLRVRYVKIANCWADGLNLPDALRRLVPGCWPATVDLPIAAGDVLTPEAISQAMRTLANAIRDDSVHGYGLRSQGELGVLHIDVDYDVSPDAEPGTVGVTFRPHYVRFSLERIGDNVLPIPRSPRPTLSEDVPAPLLALKPTFGLSHDRTFGTAVGAGFDVDLFDLADAARRETARGGNRHLDVHGQGLKAMDEPFYRVDAGVRYRARRLGTLVQELTLRADYDGLREPLGASEHTRHAGSGTVGVTLGVAANTRLSLDLGFRRADDTIELDTPSLRTHTTTDEQTNRVLLDTIPPPIRGFLRSALWEDNGWVSGGGAYQRVTGRLGYAREIAIGGGQTVGVESLAGGGRGWGAVPTHARFFGGNEPGQFLYDGPSGSRLLNMPAGPLIRSFGERQATVHAPNGERHGGEAFWHLNLTVALPIPIRWFSRPLIPNENTDLVDKDDKPLTLKQLLHTQVDVTGPSMLRAVLKREGLSDGEADAKARKVFDEIKPATDFIIDDAMLFAIKPLLMLDVARLYGGSRASEETWVAAGAGVQLTVVVAKFELGYMRTVSGRSPGSDGNVFARLVFQNLF